jgi:hypothetical protein
MAGVFLTPDSVQGNAQGLNPYGYVGGNPETNTDPTGHMYAPPGGGGGGGSGNSNGNGGNGNPPPTCQQQGTCGDGGDLGGGSNGGELDIKPELGAPTCGATCQQEQQAYNIAQSASEHFTFLAGRFNLPGWVGLILSGISASFLKLFSASILGGLLTALSTLSSIAADIAGVGLALATGALTDAALVTIGTAIFYGQVNHYIEQELSYAPCTDPVCNGPAQFGY